MSLMKECNKNLNLNIKMDTYEEICRTALKEGRKPGNFARQILEKWVKDNRRTE